MKLLFLHLSDMHIKDESGYNCFQLEKIVDAAISTGEIDHVAMIISGDLAFSGQRTEYACVNRCIKHIIEDYKSKTHNTSFIPIVSVPGNHDIAFPPSKEDQMTSSKLHDIRKVNAYEKHVAAQTYLQRAFFQFSKDKTSCDWGKSYQYIRRVIKFDDYSVEFNMINSGIFSTMDEDKGLHYLSSKYIDQISEPSGADFVVSIMHHAPEWYTDDIKHQLEDALYQKSSILFLGHEHYIEQKTISHERMPHVLIQAGGCLCENDDWKNSSFFTGVLDTTDNTYIQSAFLWNPLHKQYEQSSKNLFHLTNKPSIEKRFLINENYLQSFFHDSKHDHLADDFRHYFVFPRIQQQNSEGTVERDIVEEDEFVAEILDKKRILIYGGYNLGKSTLLKELFYHFLIKDYIPVYCDINNIHGKNIERMIRNSFEDTYGSEESDYIRFQQTPKDRKIVFVDDTDQISPDSFDPFLRQLVQTFEYVVMASKQLLDLNLVERVKSIFEAEDSLYRYTILPFYADKRQQLIQNIVKIKAADKTTVEKTTKLLTEAISSQRRSIILDPDFIINYAEYFCNNIGEISSSDSGVFSKVFEANITSAISPYCQGKLSVGKVFAVLGKIAYHIHFNKSYPLSRDVLIEVIEKYNDEYGTDVSPKSFIDIICKSKLIIQEEQYSGQITYRFSSRNYLAYFVAREVNAAYYATHDPTDLEKILRCACFGINADILLFISYITDNVQILNTLLLMAQNLVNGWSEFDYSDEKMPQYLKATKFDEILPPQPEEFEAEQKAIIASERAEYNALRIANIYDYDDDAAEDTANQLIRACSLLIVIAKCLPGFEHIMKKTDKEAFVEMIYKMPNRIFGQWASMTDHVITEIIEYFQSQGHDYYQRTIPVSKDEILQALQKASISLLLDMYNMASYYSARENTQGYLASYPYKERASYSVEHLMMLERARHTSAFTSEAISLIDHNPSPALITSVAYVVRHAIVFTPEFQQSQIDQLANRLFSTKESRTKLLAERYLRPGAIKKE